MMEWTVNKRMVFSDLKKATDCGLLFFSGSCTFNLIKDDGTIIAE